MTCLVRLRSARARRSGPAVGSRSKQRKTTLAELLHGIPHGIAFNRHFTGDGPMVFKHACALGCGGTSHLVQL
jgi:hypothetical protein